MLKFMQLTNLVAHRLTPACKGPSDFLLTPPSGRGLRGGRRTSHRGSNAPGAFLVTYAMHPRISVISIADFLWKNLFLLNKKEEMLCFLKYIY